MLCEPAHSHVNFGRVHDEEEDALEGNPHMPIERASENYIRFARQDPTYRPFAHPFYWA
jgi:hypothetical protein